MWARFQGFGSWGRALRFAIVRRMFGGLSTLILLISAGSQAAPSRLAQSKVAVLFGGSGEEMYPTGALAELGRVAAALRGKGWEVREAVGPGGFTPENATGELKRLRQRGLHEGDQVYFHVVGHGEALRDGSHGLVCESADLFATQEILSTASALAGAGVKVGVVLDASQSDRVQRRALPYCLVTTTQTDLLNDGDGRLQGRRESWADEISAPVESEVSLEHVFRSMRKKSGFGLFEISTILPTWADEGVLYSQAVDPTLADVQIALTPSPRPLGLYPHPRVGDQILKSETTELDGLLARRAEIVESLRFCYAQEMKLSVADFAGMSRSDRARGVAFFNALSLYELQAISNLRPLTVAHLDRLAWLKPDQKKWFRWLLLHGGVVGDRMKVFFHKADRDWGDLVRNQEELLDRFAQVMARERDRFEKFAETSPRPKPDFCGDFRF